MFDVLSCFDGSVNCNWKWFYQKYFPLGLQLGKYFHWASCSYLEILWIGILINRTVPLTSLLTLCILECVSAPPRLRVTHQLIKNKISRITEATSVIKAVIFLAAIIWSPAWYYSIIRGGSCLVEELCGPSRPDRRVSQLQLQQQRRGGGKGTMILQTADIEHWTAR